ncbi:site-specific integrase [Corynebacterium qintianiae]|uniref:site-specific integrase n=1 Tax=Corynebacterium qintianiae TaxID=2709392 RepID=UPI0013EBDF2C|nr:site-specific integrase [Corynebacterium qintianiae]
MNRKIQASRAKLAPGEDSIERVVDALPPRGPYEAKISVKLWDGVLYRPTIRARTKGEFRRIAREKRDIKLASTSTQWTRSAHIDDFITQVSRPVVEQARLRPNTLKRYKLAAVQLELQLKGLAIGEAVKFRTLEHALQTIAATHGAESGRQARTVLSKYILDQLLREGLIDHNPLRGVSIDLGTVKKSSKPSSSKALTDAQYDVVVDHLIARDVTFPMPPGTDRRRTSINKHDLTVALTLLQAGTGLRISEALALTKSDVTITDTAVSVTVRPDVSKTHRGRSVPILDTRIEEYWRDRLAGIRHIDPLIPAPGDRSSHWRTDNAVKSSAVLYKDVGAVLGDPAIAEMRSHAWRTVLNNRALARGVSAEVRSAFFGHTEAMNQRAYTDLTDITSMAAALNPCQGSGTQSGTLDS